MDRAPDSKSGCWGFRACAAGKIILLNTLSHYCPGCSKHVKQRRRPVTIRACAHSRPAYARKGAYAHATEFGFRFGDGCKACRNEADNRRTPPAAACAQEAKPEAANPALLAAEDRRITRSKRALRDALVELIEERGPDQLQRQRPVRPRDLNRRTLYNNLATWRSARRP